MFAQHPGNQGKEGGVDKETAKDRKRGRRGKRITLQQSQPWFPPVIIIIISHIYVLIIEEISVSQELSLFFLDVMNS